MKTRPRPGSSYCLPPPCSRWLPRPSPSDKILRTVGALPGLIFLFFPGHLAVRQPVSLRLAFKKPE